MEYMHWVKDTLDLQLDPRLEVTEVGRVGSDMETEAGAEGVVIERGLKAGADIPANSTLAIVPFSSTITIETQTDLPNLSRLKAILSEDDLLALLILHETKKAEASKWHQHLTYIPRVYHSVINFTEDELQLLRGSNLQIVARTWQLQLTEDHQRLLAVIGAESEGIKPTLKEYRWALCTIWSRCLTIERNGRAYRALVPFVDLLNHRPNAQVGHTLNPQNDCLYLFSGETYLAGNEIFLNYGAVGNARLLMLYGFALSLDDNPHTIVDVYASLGEDSESDDFTMRRDLLRRKGLWDEGKNSPTKFQLAHNKWPTELLTFLYIQHLSTQNVRRLLADESLTLELVVDFPVEKAVLDAALSSIRDMLRAYPTSVVEDEQMLSKSQIGSMSHREVQCRRLVHSEKVILHSVLELLQCRQKELLEEDSR